MKLVKLVVLTGLLGLMSFSVMADEVEAPDYAVMNANGDDGVDAAEYDKGKNAGVKVSFADADKDGNGKISESEYEVIKEPECE